MKIVLLLFCVLFLSACAVEEETQEAVIKESFCGSSTQASCTTDADCITAGCSGQICQSASEEEGKYKVIFHSTLEGFAVFYERLFSNVFY